MTRPTPSPMAVPDLAGLLRKPFRHPPQSPTAAATEEGERETDTGGELRRDERFPDGFGAPTTERVSSPDPIGARVERAAATTASPVGSTDKPAKPRREYLRSVSLYLPRSLHAKVGSEAQARGVTRTALILTSINATHGQLTQHLHDDRLPQRPGELFEIPQTRSAAREPAVEVKIRLTDAQHTAIAELTGRHQVSRSRLAETAVTLYLRQPQAR